MSLSTDNITLQFKNLSNISQLMTFQTVLQLFKVVSHLNLGSGYNKIVLDHFGWTKPLACLKRFEKLPFNLFFDANCTLNEQMSLSA